MGKLRFGRVMDRFCLSSGSGFSCLCSSKTHGLVRDESETEIKPLIATGQDQYPSVMRLKDVIAGPPTLAFQMKPKMVVLRVSMHCNGCARKVERHISKMEGVTSYQVDLETKMVVVTGDIIPFQVLESVSKVKTAEIWNDQT